MSVDPEVQYTDLMKQLVDEYALPLRIQYQARSGAPFEVCCLTRLG